MKIAVTTEKGGMKDKVCQDFDTCSTITIIDSSSMKAVVYPNPDKTDNGKKAAKEIINHKAKVVITGVCTPSAMKLFFKGNVRVYSGFGTVKDVVTALLKGKLTVQKVPRSSPHSRIADAPPPGSIFRPSSPR